MTQIDQLQAQLETTQLLLQECKKDCRQKDRQISILNAQIADFNFGKINIQVIKDVFELLLKIHVRLDHILETLNKAGLPAA